jgi:hypothetical protein
MRRATSGPTRVRPFPQTRVQADLTDHLYRSRTVEIPASAELTLYGRVGESADEFAGRCPDAAADAGDREAAALRTKYERKLADLLRRIDTAQDAVARAQSARTSTMASDLIGGLFGGRRSVSASMRRASTAQGRVSAAADKVETLQQQLADVQAELDSEVAAIRAEWDARAAAVGTVSILLEKSDVSVASIGLVWIPRGPERARDEGGSGQASRSRLQRSTRWAS